MNAICNQWEDAKVVFYSGTSANATNERHVEHIRALLQKYPSIICTMNVAEARIPAACFTFSLTTLEVKGLYKVDSTHAELRSAHVCCWLPHIFNSERERVTNSFFTF